MNTNCCFPDLDMSFGCMSSIHTMSINTVPDPSNSELSSEWPSCPNSDYYPGKSKFEEAEEDLRVPCATEGTCKSALFHMGIVRIMS